MFSRNALLIIGCVDRVGVATVTPMTNTPTTYASWGEVPPYLYSRAQLADMECPRVPGPVAGWVRITNWRGKREDLELFELAESTPTSATVPQLEAARRRSGRTRTCADCGAIGDLLLRGDPPLCRACAHIAVLRAHQEWLSQERQVRATRVAGWLEQGAVVLYVRRIRPPRQEGARLPAAVDLAEGGARVAELLRGRIPLVWGQSDQQEVFYLQNRLSQLGLEETGGRPVPVGGTVSIWRGQASVTVPRGIRAAVAPGRSDRLAWILARIAESAREHDNGRGTQIGSAAV